MDLLTGMRPAHMALLALSLGTSIGSAYGVSPRQVTTAGAACFAPGAIDVPERARTTIAKIVNAQPLDLMVVIVTAYGDDAAGNAGPSGKTQAALRAERVKSWLASEHRIEGNRIYPDGRPMSAWPAGRTTETGAGVPAQLACAATPQTPLPVVIELVGSCRPGGTCFDMQCDADGCGRRPK